MANTNEEINTRYQVAGNHYMAGYQHWDLVADCGLDYFCGQISKYVMRCRKKGGKSDLEKALHFTKKYINLKRQNRVIFPILENNKQEYYEKFLQANKDVSEEEKKVIRLLLNLKTIEDLCEIRAILEDYLLKF